MLPGALIARRRVQFHGDVASSAAEHAHHHSHYYHAASSTTGTALAARIRLEEKLRGAALPSRLMRDGRSTTILRHPLITRRDVQDVLGSTGDDEPVPELWRPAPPDPADLLEAAAVQSSSASASALTHRQRRAELTRTLSTVDVCLDEEMPERRQRAVTRLPCFYKYHSECVLPWVAMPVHRSPATAAANRDLAAASSISPSAPTTCAAWHSPPAPTTPSPPRPSIPSRKGLGAVRFFVPSIERFN